MDEIKAMLRELVMQVARVAFAIEAIAKNGYHVSGYQISEHQQPCRCCGSTLTAPGLSFATCPVCRTENAR